MDYCAVFIVKRRAADALSPIQLNNGQISIVWNIAINLGVVFANWV